MIYLTNALESIRFSIEPSIVSSSIEANSVDQINVLGLIRCSIEPLIMSSSIDHLIVSQLIRLMHYDNTKSLEFDRSN
jgi:hypothetical protein